jgi:CubicO group peptidase (beta-lactamase class C family)
MRAASREPPGQVDDRRTPVSLGAPLSRTIQVYAALLSWGAVLSSVSAQAPGADRLSARADSIVLAELKAQKIPGVSLGVMHRGKIVKAKGYGLASVELNVPVTRPSVFQTGSVGKQFTATAVMMLVESGRLSLDDRIIQWFPEAPMAWREITVRHLLTHTSGIPDYGAEESTMGKGVVDFHRPYTEDELVRTFAALPLEFQPGDKSSYSNTGYVILGALIRRVTGQFYGDFLQEHVFKPLGMTATQIISEADIVPNRAAGYRLVQGQIKNQEWVDPSFNTTADGALYSSVPDMAKWDEALYGEKLLKQASLEQMWTPVKLNSGTTYPYGFGWRVDSLNGHRRVWHDGGWQGFTMSIQRYPDDGLTVVVFTNLDEDNSHPAKIAEAVAAIYLPVARSLK